MRKYYPLLLNFNYKFLGNLDSRIIRKGREKDTNIRNLRRKKEGKDSINYGGDAA